MRSCCCLARPVIRQVPPQDARTYEGTRAASNPIQAGADLPGPRSSKLPEIDHGHRNRNRATLHRVRFVITPLLQYVSRIYSINLGPQWLFPHVVAKREVLAIGRGNGNIDILVWIGGEGIMGQPSAGVNRQGWVLQRVRMAMPTRRAFLILRMLVDIACASSVRRC